MENLSREDFKEASRHCAPVSISVVETQVASSAHAGACLVSCGAYIGAGTRHASSCPFPPSSSSPSAPSTCWPAAPAFRFRAFSAGPSRTVSSAGSHACREMKSWIVSHFAENRPHQIENDRRKIRAKRCADSACI